MPVRLSTTHVTATRTSAGELPLRSLVPRAWVPALRAQLDGPRFAALWQFVDQEYATGSVFPPRAQIFAALKHTPPSHVKVVVIGQDPYPTKGNANGLAFSVAQGMKVPASLQNIFKGLQADTGQAIPASGDLTPWTKQGVLLLNTVLTVREGQPNSHKGKGWEDVTQAILKKVNDEPGPVVFLCLGAQAKAMAESMVDTHKHTILSAPHPSPLNGKAFEKAAGQEHLFTEVNRILTDGGRTAVDWSLEAP
ncbi:MAG: uracil-DNA glycosylase [Myxococcaceae bacterium]|nr:uracil-DNA glycosylase [Myxococcaceae bacterium]